VQFSVPVQFIFGIGEHCGQSLQFSTLYLDSYEDGDHLTLFNLCAFLDKQLPDHCGGSWRTRDLY
jgi:hypothetical protein